MYCSQRLNNMNMIFNRIELIIYNKIMSFIKEKLDQV